MTGDRQGPQHPGGGRLRKHNREQPPQELAITMYACLGNTDIVAVILKCIGRGGKIQLHWQPVRCPPKTCGFYNLRVLKLCFAGGRLLVREGL